MQKAEFETIRAQAEGPRGSLTLCRPKQLNALSTLTLREITEAAEWFNRQPDLKVVVVSGEGRVFSAGADVSVFTGGDGLPSTLTEEAEDAKDAVDPRDAADAGRIMADALERMNAVTIASIRGHCVGGGVVIVASCDLRIAAKNTRFSIPEVDLGIPLAWGGIPRLGRDVGPALAKELVMTCRPFDADEAKAIGFLNRVVPDNELDDAVETLAAELAEKAKLALLSTKRHINAVTEQMVGAARSWADADGLVAGLRDPEGRAAAARYFQKLRSK